MMPRNSQNNSRGFFLLPIESIRVMETSMPDYVRAGYNHGDNFLVATLDSSDNMELEGMHNDLTLLMPEEAKNYDGGDCIVLTQTQVDAIYGVLLDEYEVGQASYNDNYDVAAEQGLHHYGY